MYSVKEIFPTLQGEGAHTGRAAVFCRFSGCNLWSGREIDRKTSICQFCDTDFVGTDGNNGGKFATACELSEFINEIWLSMNKSSGRKFVVFTGGEPILQLDQALIDELHSIGFEVAVETNGTLSLPNNLDWVCVSPKLGSELVVKQADEIKFVVPQIVNESLIEEQLKRFEKMNFKHFFLQAKDDLNKANNLALAISLCKKRPLWRLSIQTHKLLGID